MLEVHFIKSCQQSSLPWILCATPPPPTKKTKTKTKQKPPTKNKKKKKLAWASTNQQVMTTYFHPNWNFNFKMDTKFIAFSCNCDLEWRSSHPNWYQNVQHKGLYYHTKFERKCSVNVQFESNQFVNIQMHAYVNFFVWIHSVKQKLFSCFNKSYSKAVELFHHMKFHPDQMKSVRENEANRFCFVLTMWPIDTVKVSESSMKW